MLCQYLAVFGRDDDERRDEDAICSGQKLKGGRAGVAGGAVRRKGRDGADRSIEFNMRGEIEEERQRERRRMSCQQDDSARLAPVFGSVHAAFARVLVASQNRSVHHPRCSRCHEHFDIVPLMHRRPLEICIEFA